VRVEQAPYVAWFTVEGREGRCMLLDFCEQSITQDGFLCPDKPIRASDENGLRFNLDRGTKIRMVKSESKKPDLQQPPEAAGEAYPSEI
jgi:hypothetical protein